MTLNSAVPVDRPPVRPPDTELPPPVIRQFGTVIQQFGTPVYAYDLERVRAQVTNLRRALPPEVAVLYSVKANPLPELCRLLADAGLGAEVASPGELRAALAAGFPPPSILVNGPYKHPDLLAMATATPTVTLSVDSVSELAQLVHRGEPLRVMLRLRPDYDPAGAIPMGPVSRFGIPIGELAEAGMLLHRSALNAVGFHIYSGSQILRSDDAVANLRNAFQLSRRAAEITGITPELLDLGGGFGIPYGPHQPDELDLDPVAAELRQLRHAAGPAQLMVELGRYLVAPAGWYLTRVVAEQHYSGRVAAVVDGGTHHRPDLCGLDLPRKSFPPLVFEAIPRHSPHRSPDPRPTDVVGCLCLPWDILAYDVTLPPLQIGDVLVFANSGAYGLSAAPHSFIGHAPPTEVVFDHVGLLHATGNLPIADNTPISR